MVVQPDLGSRIARLMSPISRALEKIELVRSPWRLVAPAAVTCDGSNSRHAMRPANGPPIGGLARACLEIHSGASEIITT